MPPPANPMVFVDLTIDDDDEDSNTSNMYSRAGVFLPTSNHRLPMSNGLPFCDDLPSIESGTIGGLGRNYVENMSLARSRAMAQHARSPSLQSSRKSDNGPSTSTSRRSTPVVELPARRPEVLNVKSFHSSPILPNGGVKRQKIAHHGRLPGTQSALSRQSHPARVEPLTSSTSIFTGASRAAAGDDAATASAVKREEILRKQVIPHCKEAVLLYKNELPKDVRRGFGTRIASALVTDPDFVSELDKNEAWLSKQYESKIAKQAEKLAADYVQEYRDKQSALQSKVSLMPAQFPRPLGSPALSSFSVIPKARSENSTDTEEIFELPINKNSTQASGNGQSLRSSFSPATSYSDEATEENRGDENRDLDITDSRPKHLPKRDTRAKEPLYAPLKRTRRKRNAGNQVMVPSSQPQPQPKVTVPNRNPQNTSSRPRPEVVVPQSRTLNASPLKQVSTFRAPQLKDPVGALLREREMHGSFPIRARRGQSSFKAMFTSYLEDCYVRQSRWTDCSGTILTLTWTSPEAFICGAVAHVDEHHMQYNKPGNLLLGSTNHDTLKSYPDHKIIRPIVSASQNASNALDAMRQTQDPWIYTPVVSSAHSECSGYTFTASFDQTVKIWNISKDGATMKLKGIWEHGDRINFVAASSYHKRVATASVSMSDAIRVYSLDGYEDDDDISEASFDAYCGNKASEQGEEVRSKEKWAYYPSTIQWGISSRTANLLLVGWSPRSDSGEDLDIPEDKRNTGEICLWDTLTSKRVPIHSAKTQNVFEVIWHPTQPVFLVATSPSGTFDADNVKTQIRLFGLSPTGAFMNTRTFDCPAFDINELTIMPVSEEECFVTASCTDRCTYVYDSKAGDQPIHILEHGNSLDEPENEDSGVKFACWGRSNDRFYTGSSDGYVKSWNIKAASGKAFVRDVLRVAGGIYTGAFSKDYSKLIIGDDTGTVHLLSIDDSDLEDKKSSAVVRTKPQGVVDLIASTSNGLLPANLTRPKLIIPHPPPLPPHGSEVIEDIEDAIELANRLLDEGQLRIFPNRDFPTAQRAVFQGPNYNETLLYRLEAHEDNDALKPLLPTFLTKQQFIQDAEDQSRETEDQSMDLEERQYTGDRLSLFASRQADRRAHIKNMSLELDFTRLSLSTKASLVQDRVEVEGDFVFDYELAPSREHVHLGQSRNQSGDICSITFKDLEERSKPIHVFTSMSSYKRERERRPY